jgi:hypothetical protein
MLNSFASGFAVGVASEVTAALLTGEASAGETVVRSGVQRGKSSLCVCVGNARVGDFFIFFFFFSFKQDCSALSWVVILAGLTVHFLLLSQCWRLTS